MFTVEILTDGTEVIKGKGKIVSNATTSYVLGALVLFMIGGAPISAGFVPLGIAGIITVLLLNITMIIPTAWFGAPTYFKERIRKSDGTIRILDEGIGLVRPLVDDVLLENMRSKKLIPLEINTEALSKDKMLIKIKASPQYKVDDLNTNINMSLKAITNGMNDAIESEIGKTSGLREADAFVDHRPQIEAIIQCVLKLERMPHHYLDDVKDRGNIKKKAEALKKVIRNRYVKKVEEVDEVEEVEEVENTKSAENANLLAELLKVETAIGKTMGMIFKGKPEKIIDDMENAGFNLEEIEELVNKLSPENWLMEEEVLKEEGKEDFHTGEINIFKFYKDNVSRIALLASYEDKMGKKSPVEKLYGIKVYVFRLARPSFSTEAQGAFEESRSARAKMEAAERRFQKKIKMLERFIGMKISSADAVNLTETTAGVEGVERLIISSAAEGSQSVDIVAAAKVIAGSKGGRK